MILMILMLFEALDDVISFDTICCRIRGRFWLLLPSNSLQEVYHGNNSYYYYYLKTTIIIIEQSTWNVDLNVMKEMMMIMNIIKETI